MSAKTKTYEVVHKSLYLRVNNKLQEQAVGTKLNMSPEAAKGLLAKGFIADPKSAKTVDVGDEKNQGK